MVALQAGSAFKLRKIRQVNHSTAVASVDVGPVTISSIWVNDAQGEPEVSWPRSMRGFPVVTIEDDQLRHDIEAAILSTLKGWADRRAGRDVA